MIRASICLLFTSNPYVKIPVLKDNLELCNVYPPNYAGTCYDGLGLNIGTGCNFSKFPVDYSIMYGSNINNECGVPRKSYIVFRNTNFSNFKNKCIAFSKPVKQLDYVVKNNAKIWGSTVSFHTPFMVSITYASSLCQTVRVYGASLNNLHSDEYGMLKSAFADGHLLPVC